MWSKTFKSMGDQHAAFTHMSRRSDQHFIVIAGKVIGLP
jgi:hypothetical protein